MDKIRKFLDRLDSIVRDLELERQEQRWQFLTGNANVFSQTQETLTRLLADEQIWRGITNGLKVNAVEDETEYRLRRYSVWFAYRKIEAARDVSEIKNRVAQMFQDYVWSINTTVYRYPELIRGSMTESDPARRIKINEGLSELHRNLAPAMSDLIALRNRLATDLGYAGYAQVLLDREQLKEQQWRTLNRDFLRATTILAETGLERLMAFLGRRELNPTDLPYGIYQKAEETDHAFLWEVFSQVLQKSFEAIGLRYGDLVADHYNTASFMAHLPRLEVLLTKKLQLRIFSQETSGLRFYKSSFQRVGEALSWSLTNGSIVPHPQLESPCFVNAYGALLNSLFYDSGWLSRISPVGKTIQERLLSSRIIKIIQLRLFGLNAAFELALYQNPEQSMDEYALFFEQYLLLAFSNSSYHPSFFLYASEPGMAVSQFLSEILGLNLRAVMRARTGVLVDQYLGEVLLKTLSADAWMIPWPERLAHIAGPLTADVFEKESADEF